MNKIYTDADECVYTHTHFVSYMHKPLWKKGCFSLYKYPFLGTLLSFSDISCLICWVDKSEKNIHTILLRAGTCSPVLNITSPLCLLTRFVEQNTETSSKMSSQWFTSFWSKYFPWIQDFATHELDCKLAITSKWNFLEINIYK